jgi:hypothetical protein
MCCTHAVHVAHACGAKRAYHAYQWYGSERSNNWNILSDPQISPKCEIRVPKKGSNYSSALNRTFGMHDMRDSCGSAYHAYQWYGSERSNNWNIFSDPQISPKCEIRVPKKGSNYSSVLNRTFGMHDMRDLCASCRAPVVASGKSHAVGGIVLPKSRTPQPHGKIAPIPAPDDIVPSCKTAVVAISQSHWLGEILAFKNHPQDGIRRNPIG